MSLRLTAFIVFSGLTAAGCGGGGFVVTKDPTLGDYLNEFQVALVDAQGTLQSVQSAAAKPRSPSDSNEEAEEDKPEDLIRNVLQMVSSSAQQLAISAAGHAAESDVKAIAAEAQELLKKSQGSSNPTGALQGVKQLSSKAEALKTKL